MMKCFLQQIIEGMDRRDRESDIVFDVCIWDNNDFLGFNDDLRTILLSFLHWVTLLSLELWSALWKKYVTRENVN